MRKKKIQKNIKVFLLALSFGLFAEFLFLLIENKINIHGIFIPLTDWVNILGFDRMIFMVLLFWGIIHVLNSDKRDEILKQLFKWRFLLGGLLFILCIVFELSGSSVLYWQNYFDQSKIFEAIIGVARGMRSDEWAVNTPMALSQYFNVSGSFPYFSETVRGALTDVFLVYGQPVKALAVVFRPFHWGYLFLDPARGLSFFWTGRLIALFLVSFETGMIITQKSRKLSLIYGILITWAPAVQWWFAVNGLVEMLIFGQLAILMTIHYLETNRYRLRAVYACGFFISAGAYLFTFYPPWQISFVYVFLILFSTVIYENREIIKLSLKDGILLLGLLMLFLVGIGLILFKSAGTIESVMGTVYPGGRFETGGGNAYRFFLYPGNLFFASSRVLPFGNPSELSMFFDFFPMGLFLALWILIKEKQNDMFLKLFLILLIVLSSYCLFAWPEILAKISLLSNIQPFRLAVAIGYINIILLVRSLSFLKTKPANRKAVGFAFLIALLMTMRAMKVFNGYMNWLMMAVSLFILAVSFYAIWGWKKTVNQNILLGTVILISFISGMFVNPINKGLDVIYSQEIMSLIQQVNEQENGLWIVDSDEGLGFPINNLPIMVGAATINSTNVYPDLKRWELLDPNGEYSEVYNRYAHISIHLCEAEDIGDRFILDSPDQFTVKMSLDEFEILGVEYVLTKRDLSELSQQRVGLSLLGSANGFNVYKVNLNKDEF